MRVKEAKDVMIVPHDIAGKNSRHNSGSDHCRVIGLAGAGRPGATANSARDRSGSNSEGPPSRICTHHISLFLDENGDAERDEAEPDVTSTRQSPPLQSATYIAPYSSLLKHIPLDILIVHTTTSPDDGFSPKIYQHAVSRSFESEIAMSPNSSFGLFEKLRLATRILTGSCCIVSCCGVGGSLSWVVLYTRSDSAFSPPGISSLLHHRAFRVT